MKKHFVSWQLISLPWWSLVSIAILSCSVDAFSVSKTPVRGETRSIHSWSHDRRLNQVARQFHYDPSITECIGSGYSYCLDNYYLPTQAATGALCASVGDVIAQFSERNEVKEEGDSESLEYDPVRTFHYFLKGIGGGIMWAYWFDMSEPLSNSLTQSVLGSPQGDELFFQESFPSMALKERATRTVINIMMEQFFVSPLLFMVWDIPLPALLRGTPLRQIPNQIQSKMGPLFVANAKVWTLVNLITYNIPVEYRVLFSSCADIVWQSINAGITSQEISPATVPLPPPVEEKVPQRTRGTSIMTASAQQEIL